MTITLKKQHKIRQRKKIRTRVLVAENQIHEANLRANLLVEVMDENDLAEATFVSVYGFWRLYSKHPASS